MFIIMEIQADKAGNVTVLPAHTREKQNEAESVYYQIMAAAAVSTVPLPSAHIIDDHGNAIRSGFYEHTQEQAAENNEEETNND